MIEMFKTRLMAMADNDEYRGKFEAWAASIQNEDGSFSNDESGVGTAFATSWMASLLATLRFECLLP